MSDDNTPFFKMDGKEFCDEELCLAELLRAGVLFASESKYLNWHTKEIESPTITLFVLCNDVFFWGCADAESITLEELPQLYRMYQADKTWGASKWCCLRRKMRPQPPVEKAMREAGAWDADMEALPLRPKEWDV